MLKAQKKVTKKELKSDPFFEKMDQFLSFYKRNEKIIWTVILSVVVVVIAASFISRSAARKAEKAKSQISIAQFYLKGGLEDMAVSTFSEIRDGLYGKRYAGHAAYHLGGIHLQKGNYDDADAELSFFLKTGKGDNLMKATAWAGLAAIAEIKGDYAYASESYLKASGLSELQVSQFNFLENAFVNAVKAGNNKNTLQILASMEKLNLNETQKNKVKAFRELIKE
jgi:tetratricopeptide (TPR) repeat protein